MKQKPVKPQPQQPARPAPQPAKKLRPQIALTKKNYIIMAAGLVSIVAGFITLSQGSTTLAPLLLVVGYCVIIPVSLLVK